jgi:hypothetical protein
MKRPVLIKASFFVDTDLFQHLSQWEKAMMDFYAAHGAELERLSVLGGGDADVFYTVTKLSVIPTPEVKQGKGIDLKKAMSTENPKLRKNTKPLVRIKETFHPKRAFSTGRELKRKVGKLNMPKFKPQGT